MSSERRSARRRVARTARVVLCLAAPIVLSAPACSPAPADVGREATATTESVTTSLPVSPPATAGELRAEVRGTGPAPAPEDVLFVGDSVLVLVTDEVASRLSSTMHVDAADCRRLDTDVSGPCGGVPAGVEISNGVDAITVSAGALADEGIVPDAAVLVLANNATVTGEMLDEAMAAIPDVERIWWVTPRIDGFGRQDLNNDALRDLVARDDRARLIDWSGASDGQDWLADNVHPNDEGQRALGRLIARSVMCDCET